MIVLTPQCWRFFQLKGSLGLSTRPNPPQHGGWTFSVALFSWGPPSHRTEGHSLLLWKFWLRWGGQFWLRRRGQFWLRRRVSSGWAAACTAGTARRCRDLGAVLTHEPPSGPLTPARALPWGEGGALPPPPPSAARDAMTYTRTGARPVTPRAPRVWSWRATRALAPPSPLSPRPAPPAAPSLPRAAASPRAPAPPPPLSPPPGPAAAAEPRWVARAHCAPPAAILCPKATVERLNRGAGAGALKAAAAAAGRAGRGGSSAGPAGGAGRRRGPAAGGSSAGRGAQVSGGGGGFAVAFSGL